MRRTGIRRGFTLIELLIVIVVIGILATIAIKIFWGARDQGLEATMKSDLRTVVAHQENYFDLSFEYARDPADLPNFSPSPGIDITFTYAGVGGWAAVATSASLVNRVCAVAVGDAPHGSTDPVDARYQVDCADGPPAP